MIDVAARVFHERGYGSTPMQAIADELGILKGSLYYYISSKEDLLYEILQGVHHDALANIAQIDRVPGDVPERISAFVTAHLTFNVRNLTRMGIFFHDFRSLTRKRRNEIVAARDAYERRLRGLIEEGQLAGVVSGRVDSKVAAIAVMGMLNWVYQWYDCDGEVDVAQLAAVFSEFILFGLGCGVEKVVTD